jgi:hypothetical protein
MPIILATWEAEIRRMEVSGPPGQKGDPRITRAKRAGGRLKQ